MRYPPDRARGASIETIHKAIELVRTNELTLAEAAKKYRIGHTRLSAAYRRAGHAYPRLTRGRPPKHEKQREPKNAGSSGGDFAPGPILKICGCGKRAWPGAAGKCWTCDRARSCACLNPVPLTSSPEALCRRCGCGIRRMSA